MPVVFALSARSERAVGRARSHISARRAIRRLIGLVSAVGLLAVMLVSTGAIAVAAIVPTVALGTAEANAVLAGSTVTNTGPSVLDGSVGLSPGTSVTGFPPGVVLAPGTTDIANPVANEAQADLTVAYNDAAGRPIDATTPADLVNLNLQGGVYAGPNKSPLSLSGSLTLDGGGDPTTVFIFQTDSTLITATNSTINLINGAQACNVFWQVGSSATLGTSSEFTGNILALTSITVGSGVTVTGRALARNGAVTLDTDTFVEPSCDLTQPTPTAVASTPTATPTATGTAATPTPTATGSTATPTPIPVATTIAPAPTTDTRRNPPAAPTSTSPDTTDTGTPTSTTNTGTSTSTDTSTNTGTSTSTTNTGTSTNTDTSTTGPTALAFTGRADEAIPLAALSAIGLGLALVGLGRRKSN